MSLDSLMEKAIPGWMRESGPENDIVIASRIRLARNLEGTPFPAVAKDDDLRHVGDLVAAVVDEAESEAIVGALDFRGMAEIPQLERQLLIEKHLISPQHVKDIRNKAVALRNDEMVSIMVNEEDHLRIQTLYPGLQLDKALDLASEIDDCFDTKLHYAFSEDMGYLTACPTNVGTGMRASLMLHLPALSITDQMQRMVGAVRQFGLAVRGIYGEGTEVLGNIYQISNQVTLGHTEHEIVDHLNNVVDQIIAQERKARENLLESNKLALEDKVWRSYGILSNARILTTAEAMGYLSTVRLGIDLGLLGKLSPKILQELMVLIRPAHLQHIMQRDLDATERDTYRASLIRERLSR